MSGDDNVTGWTVNTLRAYLERRLDDQAAAADQRMRDAATAIQAALSAAEKAVTKAETASEKRFEAVNEFRQSLSDQTATLLTRKEYDAAHAAVLDAISRVRDDLAALSAEVVPRLETNAWRAAMTEKFETTDSQQETRIRELEAKTAGQDTNRKDSDQRKDYEQRSMNNRIVAVGVVISVIVVVVNIVIALITHHA